ncbi:UNVERIFIED_CONTAM: hypothetical protein Slati_1509300 [Sesamum latifolium]|uniref:Uncharacterized protein n=1 Tax=Sesamum latifolium TaxID=2727402 RepID=A0AAW2X6T9_9LAMI
MPAVLRPCRFSLRLLRSGPRSAFFSFPLPYSRSLLVRALVLALAPAFRVLFFGPVSPLPFWPEAFLAALCPLPPFPPRILGPPPSAWPSLSDNWSVFVSPVPRFCIYPRPFVIWPPFWPAWCFPSFLVPPSCFLMVSSVARFCARFLPSVPVPIARFLPPAFGCYFVSRSLVVPGPFSVPCGPLPSCTSLFLPPVPPLSLSAPPSFHLRRPFPPVAPPSCPCRCILFRPSLGSPRLVSSVPSSIRPPCPPPLLPSPPSGSP